MYLCPITKTKLIKAHAGGGLLWYSKKSKGRMLTHQMMKFFIGENQARELFLRSRSEKTSRPGLDCPSCGKKMKKIQAPQWTGGHDVEVCNSCHIFWLREEDHPEVPGARDMIVEGGDTTSVSQAVKLQAQVYMQKEVKRVQEEFAPPEGVASNLAGMLGLPVEIHKRDDPFGIISKALALIIIAIYFLMPEEISQSYHIIGFYPEDLFKNNGINLFTAPFIHHNLAHLLGNMYFYLLFSNDIEGFLGPLKFLLFIFLAIIMESVLMSFISPAMGVAHIGFSGVISAIIIFYALQFRDTKIGFMFYSFHYLVISSKVGDAFKTISPRWIRLPIMMVLIWWIAKEIFLYFVYERNGEVGVSYSGHLAGYLAGLILWLIFREKKYVVAV